MGSTATTTSSIPKAASARRTFPQNRCTRGDDKTFERCGEVKDIAFKIVKPGEMSHDSLKTVGKTSRINRALGERNFLVHIWGLFLHKRGEDEQLNVPMKKEGWDH